MKIKALNKCVLSMILLLCCSQSQAAHNYFVDISNDTYRKRDKFIVTENGTIKKYRPEQIESRSFTSNTKICYRPFRQSNQVNLTLSQKNSRKRQKITLKPTGKSCETIGAKKWYSGLTAFITLSTEKLLVKRGVTSGTYTKGTRGSEESDQFFTTCLANNNSFQYIQPNTYLRFVVPYHSEYNGYIVELINGYTQTPVQKATINNNLAEFRNITFEEGHEYQLKLTGKNGDISQVQLYTDDIDNKRFEKSTYIPLFKSDEEYSSIQNDIKYDFDLLNDEIYAYLYLYAINDMLSKSEALTEAEKKGVDQFMNAYLDHYCRTVIQMPYRETITE